MHEVENMLYLEHSPWHKLGTEIQEKDAYSIEICLTASGLNWDVELRQCHINNPNDLNWNPVDCYATVRTSDNSVLGIVGERYNVLQNKDAFKIFQPYLDSKLIRINTAGSLFNGKKVWILCEIMEGDQLIIKDSDEIKKYILLSHGYDGLATIRFGLTPIRVVCNNTLCMAHDNPNLFKIRHTKNMMTKIEDVKHSIFLINKEFTQSCEEFRKLAFTSINESELDTYVKRVFKFKTENISTRQYNTLERIKSYHVNSPGADSDTWWSAYNSITYYLSHDYGRNIENRYNNLWFGRNLEISKNALNIALEMVSRF